MSKLRRVLRNLIKATIPPAISGTVKEVDESDYTCVVTPFDEGADYQNVRLKVNVDGEKNGLVCIPEVGSEVLITPLFNDERAYFVNKFSKVKKWHLNTVSGSSIVFDDQGNIEINGKNFGGLVKVEELTQQLNKLEQDINTLKALIGSWIVVAADGGAALKTALAPWYGQQLSPTNKSLIENTKVKHGPGN